MQINIGGTGNPRTKLRAVVNSVLDKRLASLPGLDFDFDPGAFRSVGPLQFQERTSGLLIQQQNYGNLLPDINTINPPILAGDDPNFGYRTSVGVGANAALCVDRAIPIGGSYTYIAVVKRCPTGAAGSVLLEIDQAGRLYCAYLGWNNDRYVFSPILYDPAGNSGTQSQSDAVPVTDGAMHTVAISFDAASQQSRFFLNGVPGVMMTHNRSQPKATGYLRPFSGISSTPSYPRPAGHLIRFNRALHLPENGGQLLDCHSFLKEWYGF